MKQMVLLLLLVVVGSLSYGNQFDGEKLKRSWCDTIPVIIPAKFEDDYGIRYVINDQIWIQEPSTKYHILRWNKDQQYLIAKNDHQNKSDAGLYTRIDYMRFSGMAPYTWGFCLSVYKAATDSIAEFGPNNTDRVNPKKGCNGFPFSRMKLVQ
ncbi:MAG: hypothetical protein ACN4EP_14370 [Sediminibacterium sp.]